MKKEIDLSDYTIDECIYNPMTGYNDSYDYCHFIGEAEELENGKFKYTFYETIYHGDIEDNGDELNCDKGETGVYAEKEFDNVEEMENWACSELALEYEGETETTYAGGVDHSDCY